MSNHLDDGRDRHRRDEVSGSTKHSSPSSEFRSHRDEDRQLVRALGLAGVVLAAVLAVVTLEYTISDFRFMLDEMMTGLAGGNLLLEGLGTAAVWTLPEVLLALLLFEMLRRHHARDPSSNETRCRRCGYVLRGLSQPVCPECGERI